MSGAASKAVPRSVRLASVWAVFRTPKGLALSGRGQGHVFCARRPRMAPPHSADPARVEWFGPASAGRFSKHPYRRFHLISAKIMLDVG